MAQGFHRDSNGGELSYFFWLSFSKVHSFILRSHFGTRNQILNKQTKIKQHNKEKPIQFTRKRKEKIRPTNGGKCGILKLTQDAWMRRQGTCRQNKAADISVL